MYGERVGKLVLVWHCGEQIGDGLLVGEQGGRFGDGLHVGACRRSLFKMCCWYFPGRKEKGRRKCCGRRTVDWEVLEGES